MCSGVSEQDKQTEHDICCVCEMKQTTALEIFALLMGNAISTSSWYLIIIVSSVTLTLLISPVPNYVQPSILLVP